MKKKSPYSDTIVILLSLAIVTLIGVLVYSYFSYTLSRESVKEARRLIALKDYYNADEYLKYAIYQDKACSEAYYLKGKIEANVLGNHSKAIENLNEAQRLGSNENASIYYLLGRCYLSLGDNERSFEYFKLAEEAIPDNDSLLFYLGEVNYRYKNDLTAAFAYWDKLAKKQPDNPLWHFTRGKLLIDLKRSDEAIKDFDYIIQAKQSNKEAWYYKGIAAMIKGDTSNACISFSTSYSMGNEEAGKRLEEICNRSTIQAIENKEITE